MKEQLQQELLEKVKEGVKPSTLKKSKSLNDLPTISKSPLLKHSHSTTDIPLIEPTELEDKISVLELKLETKDRELADKDQTIKDFRKAFQKAEGEIERLKKELADTVDEAATELVSSDNQLNQLRTKLQTASQQINQLQQELKWVKKGTDPNSSAEWPPSRNYLKLALYALLTIWLLSLLTPQKIIINQNES